MVFWPYLYRNCGQKLYPTSLRQKLDGPLWTMSDQRGNGANATARGANARSKWAVNMYGAKRDSARSKRTEQMSGEYACGAKRDGVRSKRTEQNATARGANARSKWAVNMHWAKRDSARSKRTEICEHRCRAMGGLQVWVYGWVYIATLYAGMGV